MRDRTDRRRGRGRRFLLGLIVILALLWVGYWFAASKLAAIGIERFASALSARGQKVNCVDAGIAGFPLTLELHCRGASLNANQQQVTAGLGAATASAALYLPGAVEAAVSGPLTISSPLLGGDLTASWASALVTVDAGLGGLNSASGTLAGFALQGPPGAVRFPFQRVAAKDASFAALGKDGNYRLLASAHELAIEKAGGAEYPGFSLDVALTAVKFGNSTGLDPQKTLKAWVAAGGVLKVDHLAFVAGALSADAGGTLALAANGLLSGTLTVRIVGLETLPDLAETLKPGSRDKVAQVVGGIVAFTRPTADGKAREINLVIQDGAVFAGMVPLPFVIPPVKL